MSAEIHIRCSPSNDVTARDAQPIPATVSKLRPNPPAWFRSALRVAQTNNASQMTSNVYPRAKGQPLIISCPYFKTNPRPDKANPAPLHLCAHPHHVPQSGTTVEAPAFRPGTTRATDSGLQARSLPAPVKNPPPVTNAPHLYQGTAFSRAVKDAPQGASLLPQAVPGDSHRASERWGPWRGALRTSKSPTRLRLFSPAFPIPVRNLTSVTKKCQDTTSQSAEKLAFGEKK